MSDRFCTAFHPEGYKAYGHRLVDSYATYNNGFDLYVYASDLGSKEYPFDVHGPTIFIEQYAIKELSEFQSRHKKNLEVQGKKDNGLWKDKDRRTGYNYRFDLLKFSKMIYVMWSEAHRDPTGRMVWLDGDCLLRKQLPDDFIDLALPDGYAYSYLGRGKKYSETGFLVFNLPDALPILDEWAGYCTNDTFFREKEQHSAYLFDRAREKHPDIKGYDLTPNGSGHPIYDCFVGEYISHLKGDRKYSGKCSQADALDRRLRKRK